MTPIALLAEDESESEVADRQAQIVYKKSESHKFSGLTLKGQLKKPDLSYIYKRKGVRAEKIINIPENFDEEMLQGAGQF